MELPLISAGTLGPQPLIPLDISYLVVSDLLPVLYESGHSVLSSVTHCVDPCVVKKGSDESETERSPPQQTFIGVL